MPDALSIGSMPASPGIDCLPDLPRLADVGDEMVEIDRLLGDARATWSVRAASIRMIEGGARIFTGAGASFSPDGRVTALCLRAIETGRPLVAPDASRDARFSADRLVAGSAGVRFYAGAPLKLAPGQPIGCLCLLDDAPRDLSLAQVGALIDALTAMAADIVAALTRSRDRAAIARMVAASAAQDRLIREQAAALAHSRKIFERASAAARIGVWECSLPDETLTWTGAVYDMFDLPRGSPIDRERTLRCYSEESRATLQTMRSRAIAERGGFHLDAEITTPAGRRRWIRLTATVECEDGEAVRIFGMKQDITEEKLLADQTRYLAEFDVMTGLANRSQFQARLSGEAPLGALLLVDLDGFKRVNDGFGHAAGDDCLKEAAHRLAAVCGEAELVARIGGDEFAVLLGPGLDMAAIEAVAARIVEALSRPIDRGGRTLDVGASVGIAHAGGCAAHDLFARADAALYAAKAAGRNTFRTFDGGAAQAAA